MDLLAQHIESLIFVAEKPINLKDLQTSLENSLEAEFKTEEISEMIVSLQDKYAQSEFAMELVEISNGYQFLTKPSFHNTVGNYLKITTKKRLSRAAIETLSIIAYKQPVSKPEMERIRGVSADYSLQKLLEKEIVEIVGRSDGPGKPLLYGTNDKFMDYFGLKSIDDLPKLKDFATPDNVVGEAAPIEEITPQSTSAEPQEEEERFEIVAADLAATIAILQNGSLQQEEE
jgi:segregation and condensation protein B